MRRFILTALLLLAAPAWAATTYYVDAACPSAGTGTSITCGASGPFTDIASGIAALSAQDDILNVRGIHATHGTCPGDAAGRYAADRFAIIGKNGASGHPIIIQDYGYTGAQTGEVVYIDGAGTPSGGWTQCSVCNSGTCNGVPGTCSQTWYTTDAGLMSRTTAAEQSDGNPSYKVASLAAMTNATAGYVSARCSNEPWHSCHVNSECYSGGTCTGSKAEVDSFSDNIGGALFVRSGASPPPYVFFDNNGQGFYVSNSSYITMRGFIFRDHCNGALVVDDASGAVGNISFINNRVYYSLGRAGGGSDYGVAIYRALSATIQGNELAWSGSEGIHSAGRSGGTALTVSGNWIHHQGELGVIGTAYPSGGSPAGAIFANDGGFGDYTGSVADGNLFDTNGGYSVILENDSNGWTLSNNIFRKSGNRGCLKLDAVSVSVNNTVIFNNIFDQCGITSAPSPGIFVNVGAGKTVTGSLIYNNTFANGIDEGILLSDGGGGSVITSNIIRNNLFYLSGNHVQVTWPSVTASNVFTNNLAYSSTLPGGNTLVAWKGVNYTCATIGTLDATDKCSDPLLVNQGSEDYHIQTTSPAKDAGTATGMPAGRTTDICNTLAISHGLPDYNNCQGIQNGTWDIGMHEFVATSNSRRVMVISGLRPRKPKEGE